MEKGAVVKGKVGIGEGSFIKKGSVIRGPAVIGKNCIIGPDAYIGPYTAIGDNTIIINGEIEASIVIGGSRIECKKKIANSLIGKDSVISSSDNLLPKGVRLVIGECSTVKI